MKLKQIDDVTTTFDKGHFLFREINNLSKIDSFTREFYFNVLILYKR